MKKMPGMRLRSLALRLLFAVALFAARPASAAGRASASLGVSCRVVRSARVTVAATGVSAGTAPAFTVRINGREPLPAPSAERVAPDGARYTLVTVMADAAAL